DADGLRFRRSMAPARHLVEGTHLVVSHRSSANYAHWHMDSLPSVLAFEEELRSGAIRLAVPPLAGFQRQALARLGLLSAADEFSYPVVLARDLVCGSLISGRGTARPSRAISALFERLRRAGRGQSEAAAPPFIYVGRGERAAGRTMTNESEIVAALGRLGFVPVVPGTLGYDEQIDFFSAARVII